MINANAPDYKARKKGLPIMPIQVRLINRTTINPITGCCDMIDLTNEKDVAIKRITSLVEETQQKYLAAPGNPESDTGEEEYRRGVVRGLLDALNIVGGTSEKQQSD